MRKWLWVLLSFAALALLAGWVAFGPVPSELTGGQRWAMKTIATTRGQVSMEWDDPRYFFVEFLPNGKVTGRAACNVFDGRLYAVRFTDWVWSPRGSYFRTLVNCPVLSAPSESFAEREKAFLHHLSTVTSYSLYGDELRLYFDDGKQMMLFYRSDP